MYIKSLDHGAPAARKAANILVSIALALVVAVPALAVAARIVG
jgi:flagellar basal body-associated protein FliL